MSCTLAHASRLLGVPITASEAVGCLRKAGLKAAPTAHEVTITPPPYRNDFLHPVDVVEEIMIGRGMASFEPVWPQDFTVGRLSVTELRSRRVVEIMVGLGYQEMIYTYLGSTEDLVRKMRRDGQEGDGQGVIRIANPISESYETLRDSILPNLLASEAVSANALYPHRTFEVGRICRRSAAENYGSVTRNHLGLLVSHREAGFNDVRAHLGALFYYLGRQHALVPLEDPRLIPGRCASVLSAGDTQSRLGVIGEVHPEVLDNFGIQMPCAAVELDLDAVMAE
jgi:phenylalanyl-tRNA synthetase beta chain